jgi:RNA polymerase sigma-70 factor, ECF subfamily
MKDYELIQAGYRYALSLTHNADDAEDLAQDAWLKLHAKGSSDLPLFFTAIRNLYIDGRRRHQLVAFDAFDENRDGAVDLEVPADLSMDELEEALGKLRPEEREAIFLNAVEGYSAQKISTFTGRPRNTVLSLMHRGKRKMMQYLKPLMDDHRRGQADG